MRKIRKILTQKKIRIMLLILLDIFSLILCSFLALAFRFDFDIPGQYTDNVYRYLLIDGILLVTILTFVRSYANMWNYASIEELINLVVGCVFFEVIEFGYKLAFNIIMPRSYYFVKVILLFFFIGAIRYSYRIARTLREYYKDKHGLTNTMIIGAGEAGRLLITEIANNPKNFGNQVRCIIDDDSNKVGGYIRRIPIVGRRKQIAQNCEKYEIEEIIIAMPSITREKLNLIVEECQKTNANIRILPTVSEMIGKPSMNKVRPLSYEDFLGRNQIVVDVEEISEDFNCGNTIVSSKDALMRDTATRNRVLVDLMHNLLMKAEQEITDYKGLGVSATSQHLRTLVDQRDKIVELKEKIDSIADKVHNEVVSASSDEELIQIRIEMENAFKAVESELNDIKRRIEG